MRGDGATTRQMQAAPQKAVFIWVNGALDYPRRLANKLNRTDLEIVSPHWLEYGWMGRTLTEIVVDHATAPGRSPIRPAARCANAHQANSGRGSVMRFPGFQNSADAAKAVAKLLRSDFWLPTLRPNTRYARLQDDHDGKRWGILSVMFGEDSDAWVSIDMNGVEIIDRTIRFRLPVVGGGRSARTRTALHILAEAIRLDNEERSQDLSPHPSVIDRYSRMETGTAPEAPEKTWDCSICSRSNYVTVTHCEHCEYSRMVTHAGRLVPRDGYR